MTTQELKSYIDRILGNSVRLILPSYWWKRLFGLLADKIDSVKKLASSASSKVSELSTNISTLSANKADIVKVTATSGSNTANQESYKKIVQAINNNIPINVVYVSSDKQYHPVSYFYYNYSSTIELRFNHNSIGKVGYSIIYLYEDGRIGNNSYSHYITSSPTANSKDYISTSSVVYNKVDKVEGKQLSTEDFTTELKTKLENLSDFDTTEINNKVNGLQTQIDTLVSGNASTAIESFNEIIAFLDGVEDSENLDSIIASIEQQISAKQDKLVSGTSIKTINGNSILGSGDIKVVADTSNLATKSEVNAKQDKITDLETIRSGAAKGATALQSIPAEYITESELSAKKYATTSQLATKQDTISDLSTIRSNASLGATAIQKVKTINGESLVGDGDVAVVTKALYDNLIEETVTNEEVYAAAVNDLNTRLNTTNITLNTTIETTESIITDINTLTTRVSDNEEVTATSYNELNERINNNYQEGVDTYATKTALNNEVVSINTAIVENEEVIAATLNDLLSQIEALRVRVEQLENA